MNGHMRRFGVSLLVMTVLLPAGGARAQSNTEATDFCSLIEAGQLWVTVSETESGVAVTLSTAAVVDLVHEQAGRLAERARVNTLDGIAPPPGRGEWPITLPIAAVILHERVSGAVLIMTSLDPEQAEVIKEWGARVVRLLHEGRCDDLLTALGEV